MAGDKGHLTIIERGCVRLKTTSSRGIAPNFCYDLKNPNHVDVLLANQNAQPDAVSYALYEVSTCDSDLCNEHPAVGTDFCASNDSTAIGRLAGMVSNSNSTSALFTKYFGLCVFYFVMIIKKNI